VKTVRLIHFNEDDGLERRKQLEAFGFQAAFDYVEGQGLTPVLRELRANPPDAVVIDLTRLPSHGREVARALRGSKATRHVPLVFVDGDAEKVKTTKALLPDATYTTWGRAKAAIGKAIATPLTNPINPGDLMSGRPVVAKLGVKPGFKIALLASPKGFADSLKPLPAKVTFTARPEADADMFIGFCRTDRELQAHLLALGKANRQTLWLAWPKKASGVKSDLDGNVVRTTGLSAGWVDFKVCSIDDTWSGLAFKKRRQP
jgi:CheY-like chemotaxis protein